MGLFAQGALFICGGMLGFMRIIVRVQPRSKQTKLVKLEEGHYKAWVSAPPEAGRANEALLVLVAEEFNVAKSQVRIVIGKTAREKLVEITGR